ncbi:unnamed protein product [Rhizoctonia solani]|uniref:Enoyl reductase (ER) domain-containing protein n=1 Tax=Rhizoctonia solani TaxID=456999 RepID=A0A8H3CZ95_9AGAM|nr:unnamed protein product [Rhizoctonia solani]
MHQTLPTAQTSVVQLCPRGPLQLQSMHIPKPGPGRVIVRVAASTMNSLDHKILTYGILAQEWPWIGGNEYAGTVVSVGPAVENLVAGDRVVAVGVNFIEGQEVSGWQEYALLRADLCTKLADHVLFHEACTVPTAFTSASIAIAIELGLKYPDPPPAPPPLSAASIWESAMSSLGNGAAFSWNLQEGTIQDGVWLPKPKVSAIQEAPLSPEAIAKKAEAERLRREEEERKAKSRRENDARIHATLCKAFAEKVEKRRAQGPQPSVPRVPGYGTHPHRTYYSGSDPDTRPMPWDTYDMDYEGSIWDNGRAYGRFEVVDERHNALGSSSNGLGLDLGPRFGTAGLLSPESARADNLSPCGSTSASASTSMGRGGSDDSNTSLSASEMVAMSASYPILPSPYVGLVGRRGSEPSLRAQESVSTWMSVRSAPGPDLIPTVRRSPLLPTSTNLVSVRPRSSGSTPYRARSPIPSVRGTTTTSPFRVPASLSGRGRGRGSPPYRVREHSPRGHRPSSSLEMGVKMDPTWSDRHDLLSTQFSINGSTSRIPPSHPTLNAVIPSRSRESVSKPDSWSLSAGGGVPDTFFPPRLSRTENPVYVMDEPILVWGGATCVGRAALQLLKRAGYTNLLVVAARERHVELAEIAPANTKFFDYRNANIVDEIRTSIGVQKLNKVLDTVAMPHTLEPISQLVTSGAKVAALLPVNTPMPDGVEVKPVMFGRCHDYTGKDVLSFNFGKETMWPLLGELLRKGEWVYPPAVRLTGGLNACATDAMRMMSSPDYVGKRLVFDVSTN